MRSSPRHSLLLEGIKVLAEPGGAHSLDALLSQPLAWTELESWLLIHRLTPLLYYVLQRSGQRTLVPSDLLARLQRRYYRSLLHSDRLEFELKHVLRTLQSEGIPVILVKGAALARSVYPAPALRPMDDLDLLIRRGHLQRACTTLKALGCYEIANPAGYPSSFVQRFLGEQVFQVTAPRRYAVQEFLDEQVFAGSTARQPVTVDLHWHVLTVEWYRHTTCLDMDALWAAARPLDCGGIPAFQLSPEDMLVHLCLHMAIQHAYVCPAITYVDIDRVIRGSKPGVDWELLLIRACASQVSLPIYFGLHLAKQYFESPVPSWILAELKPSRCRSVVIHRITGADKKPAFERRAIGRRAKYLVQALLIRRLRDMLYMLLRVLFPGREWLIARYELKGALDVAGYHLLHPLRAVGMGLAAFWQTLVGSEG